MTELSERNASVGDVLFVSTLRPGFKILVDPVVISQGFITQQVVILQLHSRVLLSELPQYIRQEMKVYGENSVAHYNDRRFFIGHSSVSIDDLPDGQVVEVLPEEATVPAFLLAPSPVLYARAAVAA